VALLHQVLPLGEHSFGPKIPGLAEEDELRELTEERRMDIRLEAEVTFGGKDRHTLFITAQTSIYGLQMRVKGIR
jgi:hypothetical protein